MCLLVSDVSMMCFSFLSLMKCAWKSFLQGSVCWSSVNHWQHENIPTQLHSMWDSPITSNMKRVENENVSTFHKFDISLHGIERDMRWSKKWPWEKIEYFFEQIYQPRVDAAKNSQVCWYMGLLIYGTMSMMWEGINRLYLIRSLLLKCKFFK